MAQKKEHWLLTGPNIAWAIVVLILFGVAVFTQQQANHYKTLDQSMSRQAKSWQKRVDEITAKNNRTIYLPKPGNVHMTKDQQKSVQFLNGFFGDITTFTSQVAYNTNYREAKKAGIHDNDFWTKFMEAPYDKDGTPIVSSENIRMKNVRTQVIVTGDDSYIVTATYIPYHNSSDLYQESKLETRTYVFDVQGHVGNWTKMRLMQNIDMNAQIIQAGDLES